jgi:hypothetical protein
MQALLDVLKTKRSLVIAVCVSAFVFVLAVWLPNLQLLTAFWADSGVPITDKVALSLKLIPSIATNFTFLSALSTVVIALLAGINAALITELIRARRVAVGGVAAGGAGIIAGAFGVGCAACGSLILTALVGTSLGAGLAAFLPLGGNEFGFIGIGLLGYSLYLLTKQISKTTCEITL